jgi:hypothetical protein
VHYALRALIHTAADRHDLDPDRISFTKALHAARRSVRTGLDGAVTLTLALRRANQRAAARPASRPPAPRQRTGRTTKDEQLQRQTRYPPQLAQPDQASRQRRPHDPPTLSYRYWV